MLNAEQNYQKMTKLVTDQQKMTPTILVTNVILTKKYQTSKATVNDARYKVSRIVKLVEIVEIKVDCHFYFYYALLGLYSANFFC